jgi:hypothetical protein
MKAQEGVDVYIQVFLNSALVAGEWSASRSGPLILGERAHGTHCIGGCVGPRDGLEDTEKRNLKPTEI